MTTALEPRSQTLDVNGLRVHYLDWGNPGAPPIVCVHGYTSSAQAFNALARRLPGLPGPSASLPLRRAGTGRRTVRGGCV